MKTVVAIAAGLLVVVGPMFAQAPPKVILTLEDQFEKPRTVDQYKGDVLILLYGDRAGAEANKGLGEKLHVHYHPTAQGKPPAEAAKAPATPVPNLPQGTRSPDVFVVPVACVGKVPDVVKNMIRGRIKKDVPDTPVLLDFESKMKDQFGIKEGESNLLLIDTQGRVRMKVNGQLDAASQERVIQTVDFLRKEGVR